MPFLKNLFGKKQNKILKFYQEQVKKINALEPHIAQLTDTELSKKTIEFTGRLAQGATIESLLVEAFAVVRESAYRALGMRHFDTQLLGGMVLHGGKIAEMRTGEGKTLVATLAAYLNALKGKGVHVVTVNDYLAQRDSQWMSPVYERLGMTVSCNLAGMSYAEKKQAYAADITYGTNNEFGFDYLRDNMVFDIADCVQRELAYAVIDEVDSILIDEARTPLVISGEVEGGSELYAQFNRLVPSLRSKRITEEEPAAGGFFKDTAEHEGSEEYDYIVDEKNKQVSLSESGHQKVESLMIEAGMLSAEESLYDTGHIHLIHYLQASLRAHSLYRCDVDYVIKQGRIWIVDEHTGRLMEGRRWSEGLHQAIEAKEGLAIEAENQTLASITLQNYFRLYLKLSGMTGTAETDAFELEKIYQLPVVVVPTHRPMVRKDYMDIVYMTVPEKYTAILEAIKSCQERRQPVLVGTASVASSEQLARYLQKASIPHQVLNAKHHEREAEIIMDAGKPGAVTIATNMAGRGTDIVLGGNVEAELKRLGPEVTVSQQEAVREKWKEDNQIVLQAGGLHVIGTERHESRRIDNQLRGRSGRQGDPGSSQFYLSFEDNLLRIFAAERMKGLMRRLGLKSGEKIQHAWINRAIENAQKRVEALNFDARKNLLEYDDVANDQRRVLYKQRLHWLSATDFAHEIMLLFQEVSMHLVEAYLSAEGERDWDIEGLTTKVQEDFGITLALSDAVNSEPSLSEPAISERLKNLLFEQYEAKSAHWSPEIRLAFERRTLLNTVDIHWKEHLFTIEHLRQSIYLRGYAQKNPMQEYKKESFMLFKSMLQIIDHDSVIDLLGAELEKVGITTATNSLEADATFGTQEIAGKPVSEATYSEETLFPEQKKLSRNAQCYCGSNKKYKHCHGRVQ